MRTSLDRIFHVLETAQLAARERILAAGLPASTAYISQLNSSTHGFRSVHFFEASSKVPWTSGGTSSSSSSWVLAPAFFAKSPIKVLSASYCCGPTCLIMSGSMSLSYLDSWLPVTIRRFSRTENWTKEIYNKSELKAKHADWVRLTQSFLTYWLACGNERLCCHPWTC